MSCKVSLFAKILKQIITRLGKLCKNLKNLVPSNPSFEGTVPQKLREWKIAIDKHNA